MKGKRILKDEVIGKRRFELFMRDPLKKDMEIIFRSISLPNLTRDERNYRHNLIEDLFLIINEKWNCRVFRYLDNEDIIDIDTGKLNFVDYISWDELEDPSAIGKSNACYLFSSRASTVLDYGNKVERIRKKVKRQLGNFSIRDEFISKGWIFNYPLGGYDEKDNVYIRVSPGRIPIGIDIGGLTEKDKEKVTEEIWNIIKSKIKERKAKGQKYISAIRDPKELGFITSSKVEDKDFEKYLKWYDLHMGGDCNTPKGLPFRTIAAYEFLEKEYPDKAEEGKRKIAEKNKTIKSSSGREKTIKGVVGESARGEDNVEKRVKQIYQAIHRSPYPAKKKMDLFNCPEHGDKCPKECKYLKAKVKDFNKRNVLFKPLVTTGKELSAIDNGTEFQETEERIDTYFKNKKKLK